MKLEELMNNLHHGEQRLRDVDLAMTKKGGLFITHPSMGPNLNYDALQPHIHNALNAYRSELAAAVNEAKELLTKAEAAINPPPEPETIFNTPDKWFAWDELPEDYENQLEQFGDDLCIAVCTADEWADYIKSGRTGKLSYYGNNNGSQCISQIIDAANDIGAGLRVSGNPTNAVIIVKWSK